MTRAARALWVGLVVLVVLVAIAPAPQSAPTLPRQVDAPGGVIRVDVLPVLDSLDGFVVLGWWLPGPRVIQISAAISPRAQWFVLYHELTHAALHDAGLAGHFTIEEHEAIANAVAIARHRERFW